MSCALQLSCPESFFFFKMIFMSPIFEDVRPDLLKLVKMLVKFYPVIMDRVLYMNNNQKS